MPISSWNAVKGRQCRMPGRLPSEHVLDRTSVYSLQLRQLAEKERVGGMNGDRRCSCDRGAKNNER
jgi:hypothetical protein